MSSSGEGSQGWPRLIISRARASVGSRSSSAPLLAAHSSGRNAAIFRPLDRLPEVVALAQRTRALLDSLFGGEGWLRRTGLLFLAEDPGPLAELAAMARRSGLSHLLMDRDDFCSLVPPLADGDAARGLLVPDAGVMDIHGVLTALARSAGAAGARLVTGTEVRGLRVRDARVEGVTLADGSTVLSEAVVIAAGVWAAELGGSCGAELPLTLSRRHLVHLEVGSELPGMAPVVWRLGDEAYFRPEPGGVLASPCDEEPWPPGLPPTSEAALGLLAQKLARLAPALGRGAVRRAWACLRTSAPDRRPVAGADPWVGGLYWLAGLGGHGMSVGMAAGEVVAALIGGREPPPPPALAPSRLLDGGAQGRWGVRAPEGQACHAGHVESSFDACLFFGLVSNLGALMRPRPSPAT